MYTARKTSTLECKQVQLTSCMSAPELPQVSWSKAGLLSLLGAGTSNDALSAISVSRNASMVMREFFSIHEDYPPFRLKLRLLQCFKDDYLIQVNSNRN